MIEKKITFSDYNDQEITDSFFFHLNEAEIAEMLATEGDYTFDKKLEQIYKQRNGKEIMAFFKDLIYRSYGVKSLDGRRFIKTEEVKREFMETEAYSVLFMELCTDSVKGAEFVNGILPNKLSAQVEELLKDEENLPPEVKKMKETFNVVSGA